MWNDFLNLLGLAAVTVWAWIDDFLEKLSKE